MDEQIIDLSTKKSVTMHKLIQLPKMMKRKNEINFSFELTASMVFFELECARFKTLLGDASDFVWNLEIVSFIFFIAKMEAFIHI